MLSSEEYKNGEVLLIDKPLEWSSFQVVNKLRWHIKRQFSIKKIKVGHAGTLDPLATGLLIICTGNETKNITNYQAQTKEYTGIIRLGATTPSYDLETEIDATFPTAHITEALIKKTIPQFLGEILQRPPVFSAIKKDGKRLYKIARKGIAVEVPRRLVNVKKFEITKIDKNELHFRIVCSKGTYIRSLAYDLGLALNSGAHLAALRRTKIGKYSVNSAISIDEFIDILRAKKLD